MMEQIVITGYGGHAKSVIESIKESGDYEVVGYTDVEDKHVDNILYLGTDDYLEQVYQSGIHYAAVGIGFMGKSDIREKLYERLKAIGFELPAVIDPSAVVAPSACVGEGTFIGKLAVVNAEATIGKMCIINTGSIVEHDNCVENYTHIAVGTVLCGNVEIGPYCLIGANSTVIQGVKIGSHTIIGGGSIVLQNVGNHVIRFGVVGGVFHNRQISFQNCRIINECNAA